MAGATGNTGKRVVQQLSGKGFKVLAGTRVSSGLLTMIVMIIITLPNKSARCAWHKSCVFSLACSEHHGVDV